MHTPHTPHTPAHTVGQTVKFAVPNSPDEETERFIVLELRGDRVLVEFICDMRIKPTSVYLVTDMVAQ